MSYRRSIRKYRPDPISPDVLKRVLESARLAPSWKNMQCWKFIIVTEQDRRSEISQALPALNPAKNSIIQAPVTVVICADPEASGESEGKDYYLVDAAIAFHQLILAATAEGLGTCWVAWFEEEPIKASLKIPDKYRIVGLTPLGYPAENPKPRPRKELSRIFYLEEWGNETSL